MNSSQSLLDNQIIQLASHEIHTPVNQGDAIYAVALAILHLSKTLEKKQ